MTKKIFPALIVIAILGFVAWYGTKPPTALEMAELGITPSMMPLPSSPESSQSGELTVQEISEGTGAEVKSGDTVVMHYKGTLQNGTVFDSSYDRNSPFTTRIGVGEVIEGWDKGVPGMKVGGKRLLVIPPAMGYGERGSPPAIPPNATLFFEVELLEVK